MMVFPRADCWRGALMTVIPGRRGVPGITWISYKQTVQLFLILQRTVDMSKVTYREIKSCPRIQNKAMKIKYPSQEPQESFLKNQTTFFFYFNLCSFVHTLTLFFFCIQLQSAVAVAAASLPKMTASLWLKKKCKWHILRHFISE